MRTRLKMASDLTPEIPVELEKTEGGEVPTKIGPYQVVEILSGSDNTFKVKKTSGEDGFFVVKESKHWIDETGKMILENEKLICPNLVKVEEVTNIKDTKKQFIVTENCEENLEDYLSESGRFFDIAIQNFFIQMSKALESLKNLVRPWHGNITLRNILISRIGDEPVFKIDDYRLHDSRTKKSEFSAPEVFQKPIGNETSDLFSIAAICLYALRLRLPWTLDELKSFDAESLRKRVEEVFPRDLAKPAKDLLFDMLKFNEDDRIKLQAFTNHWFLKPSDHPNVINGIYTIKDYTEDKLGKGGYGIVFKAQKVKAPWNLVALKELFDNTRTEEEFKRETAAFEKIEDFRKGKQQR